MIAGRPRILVTRPRADAEALARRLDALGCQAVLAPVLAIVPVASAMAWATPDALVATSANAFLEPFPPEWLNLPVFAVGEATAAAARAGGLPLVRVGGGDVAALAVTLLRETGRDTRLLLLAGRPRKPDLERALDREGRSFQVIERYEARPVAWTGAVAADLRGSPPMAALHFSRRSATLAAAAATATRLTSIFQAMRHACLSADVADALRASGIAEPVVAAEPNADSLLQALIAMVGNV